MALSLLLILVLGAFLLVTVLLVAAGASRVAAGGDDLRERIQVYAAVPDLTPRHLGSRRNTRLVRLRLRLNSMLSSFASDKMALQLVSANWAITVTEYMLIRLGSMLSGLLLGWLVSGWLVAGLVIAIVAYLVPGIALQRAINKRRRAFEKQLIDVLVLVNGAVRAGFSLLQSLEVVEREMKAPASEEFHRVHREVGLGLSLSQALANLSRRMENQDLELLVTAINIHQQVGGNLSTMLSAVTDTIRDRIRLFAEARVLTTQQRFTSYIITILPVAIAGLLFMLNPEYMRGLFEPGIICIPIGAGMGIIAGHIVIQRIAKLEI